MATTLGVMSRDVVESVEGYAANRRVVSVVVVEVEPAGQRQASFGGPGPRKVDTSGVSYAAWVSVADVSASKSSGARRLHQECRLRVL